MATPNLSLALPTVGGDSDTWGTKLNTALTAVDTWAGGSASPLLLSGGTLTGPVFGAVGSAAAPGISFAADSDTGFYRIGANNIGVAVGGVKVLDIAASGLTVSRTGADVLFTLQALTSGQALFNFVAVAGNARGFLFQSGSLARWLIECDAIAESGANAGSNIEIARYDDAGSLIDVPIVINRNTGVMDILKAPTFGQASTTRTNLGLGTAATQATGTSGATLPFLNGTNTWANAQTFSALATLSAGADMTPATAPSTTAVGFLGSPVVDRAGDVTLDMTASGKTQRYTGSGGNTHTIPANGSVAYPIGTVLGGNNDGSGTLTIAITSDTLKWLAAGTGSRTVAIGGTWSALKLTATTWRITGDLLS